MKRILAVFENTFKESLRQRIMLLLVIFGVLMIVLSIFLGPFALGETFRIVRDVGLAAAALFSILIIIIIGSGLLYRDIDKRTLYTVITKPVRRSEIIIGKFLGLIALVTVLVIAMAIIQQLVIFLIFGTFDVLLLIAVPFTILEAMVLLSIMLLFSSFSSPTLSVIMGVILYIIGHASPDIKAFAEYAKAPALKYLAYGVYYILPNLENFNYRLQLVHGLTLFTDQVLFSLMYGLIYTALLLYITIIVFEKREFK